MKASGLCKLLGFAASTMVGAAFAHGGLVDDFDGDSINGWFFFTGDGSATMDFEPHDGFARIKVDARQDPHNVWWAIIKRDIAGDVDLTKLQHPSYELRVEARVRLSHAPRRLNFMINTQRTTDFHEHLMEFDIPETGEWHTISMTTRNLDAVPGDSLFVQLGVTDWGYGTYEVDLDYYRAEIVNVAEAGPDVGEPLQYHPAIPPIESFSQHLPATHSALVNLDFPDVHFGNWQLMDSNGRKPVMSIDNRQWAVLRWDFGQLAGKKINGPGMLEFTLHSIAHGGDYIQLYGEDLGIEFGRFRVIEILGGDPSWAPSDVTFHSLTQGKPYEEVFNGQMVYDVELEPGPDGKIRVTLSRPVLQRMIDGTTKGLLIRPLGAVQAAILPADSEAAPSIHLNLAP